ncbi:hypothetical protein [Consotaella salsifontis]|uniref:Lipoprotein n=1 Tax=Consotaella salsifontis TaxID=1365950 RepID=A0A1T4PUN2_9HYPH|nr:hypothetical protein [Consotaella salsifontis]SJZ95255.1 hypothetical protein SAMN05428963_104173 [Consotaella salsifontis]
MRFERSDTAGRDSARRSVAVEEVGSFGHSGPTHAWGRPESLAPPVLATIMLLALGACTNIDPTMGIAIPPEPISGASMARSSPPVGSAPRQSVGSYQPAAVQSAPAPMPEPEQAAVVESQPMQQPASPSPAAMATTEVQFLPVIGAPVDRVELLSQALSRYAQSNGIAIVAEANQPGGLRLKGYFSAFADGGSTTVTYVWDVLDTSDERVRRLQGQENVAGTAGDPWSLVGQEVFDDIAARTLGEVAEFAASRRG